MRQLCKPVLWRLAARLHHIDFSCVLPGLARLPLPLGYALARLRGHLNALTGRDWRSMGLGFRHIHRQSMVAYAQLFPSAGQVRLKAWRNGRFVSEALDEFEARLIARGRLQQLHCDFVPQGALAHCRRTDRGLVLLTVHFESFFAGVGFLGRSGAVINLMSSAVTKDPRADPAVREHFESKYRGLEQYLNGGKVLDMEEGLRPFYAMLNRRETLVLLGDAPVLPRGASMSVEFLGGSRSLAGGGLRMAQSTGSDIGGFICVPRGAGRYRLVMCEPGPSEDPATIERIYQFFSKHILAHPGGWWASDLLPAMPLEKRA